MRMGLRGRAAAACALLVFFAAGAQAAEDQQGGVKAFGVVYNMADDRKVERVGGKYEPEGLDKYLKRKFDALQAEIKTMNEKLDLLQKDMAEIKTAAQTNPAAAGTQVVQSVPQVVRTRR